MLVMAGLVRADDLEDSYTKLKADVEKKDADAVKGGGLQSAVTVGEDTA